MVSDEPAIINFGKVLHLSPRLCTKCIFAVSSLPYLFPKRSLLRNKAWDPRLYFNLPHPILTPPPNRRLKRRPVLNGVFLKSAHQDTDLPCNLFLVLKLSKQRWGSKSSQQSLRLKLRYCCKAYICNGKHEKFSPCAS